ncbi:LOW QUALITY PROTEIN: hypothetical protein PHMEG_00023391 [Phytophthora megakarya]|uniref:Uncharacterized protein n=1 Tax=Phytophthora megakarya TaxID=4795 RepID=A0A225VI94_9STRA|nr:LOW QUALITY PROTEIN: hypothetical protein PHMEG_00023391 [Phytophthora megakarya]
MNTQASNTSSLVHLSTYDWGNVVRGIEVPENFRTIHGTSGQMKVRGKPMMKKVDGFKLLADHFAYRKIRLECNTRKNNF